MRWFVSVLCSVALLFCLVSCQKTVGLGVNLDPTPYSLGDVAAGDTSTVTLATIVPHLMNAAVVTIDTTIDQTPPAWYKPTVQYALSLDSVAYFMNPVASPRVVFRNAADTYTWKVLNPSHKTVVHGAWAECDLGMLAANDRGAGYKLFVQNVHGDTISLREKRTGGSSPIIDTVKVASHSFRSGSASYIVASMTTVPEDGDYVVTLVQSSPSPVWEWKTSIIVTKDKRGYIVSQRRIHYVYHCPQYVCNFAGLHG